MTDYLRSIVICFSQAFADKLKVVKSPSDLETETQETGRGIIHSDHSASPSRVLEVQACPTGVGEMALWLRGPASVPRAHM